MPTITVPSFPDRQAGAARRTLIWMQIRPAPASDGNRPGTFWRHRDFLLRWGGQAVSEAGSAVTVLALPLTAVVVLRASTFRGRAADRTGHRGLPADRAAGGAGGGPAGQAQAHGRL
jgi:hypothetical protein